MNGFLKYSSLVKNKGVFGVPNSLKIMSIARPYPSKNGRTILRLSINPCLANMKIFSVIKPRNETKIMINIRAKAFTFIIFSFLCVFAISVYIVSFNYLSNKIQQMLKKRNLARKK